MPTQHACTTCSRQFQRKAELDRHAKRQTPCRPPTYTCLLCGKGYASYQTLWRHNNTFHPAGAAEAEEPTTDLETSKAHTPDGIAPHKPNNGTTTAENRQLWAALEKSQQQQEADTARILELEAAYDDLAELQRATIRKLLEREAQADNEDKDTAAALSEAKAEAKRAKDDAEQARTEIGSMAREYTEVLEERQRRIAEIESENTHLQESLAEAQTARLVFEEEAEKASKPTSTKKSKNKKR